MLDTKTAIEANAATSRRISVMRVSCLFMFLFCSALVLLSTQKNRVPGGTKSRQAQ
jgi:hypothetical protein